MGIPLKEEHGWGGFEPVMAAGSKGDWDSISVGDVVVILDGDTYKVWYVGRNDSGRRMICAGSMVTGSAYL